MPNKRKQERRDFTYYMQVTDHSTKEIIGYLSDISTGGFKLECEKKIPTGQDFNMHIELSAEMANKTSMNFIGRSKWCQPDHVDPTAFNVGFEIIAMTPGDMEIFQRIFEKYGSENRARKKSSSDYLWR